MKLITLNIEGSKYLLTRVLPFLKREQPDVICLQEVFAVEVDKIEKILGVHGRFVPMADVDRVTIHTPKPLGLWGIYLGTRLPTGDLGHQFYKGNATHVPKFLENGNHNAPNRVVVWMEVTDGQADYVVATTHAIWSEEGAPTLDQHHYLDKLLKIIHQLPPHILCGDFNAPRGGEIFNRLKKEYRDNIPTTVKTTLDKKFHRAGELNFVVDGMFSHPEYTVKQVRVVDGLSDHMAVVGEVSRRS